MGFIYRIYRHTSTTHKGYIGQSIDYLKRWDQHRKDSIHDPRPLYCSIRKHGISEFTFEVLIECRNEDMNKYEKEFILLYGTYPPPYGYNLTTGGDSKYEIHESVRQKISVSQKVSYESTEGEIRKENLSCSLKKFWCSPDGSIKKEEMSIIHSDRQTKYYSTEEGRTTAIRIGSSLDKFYASPQGEVHKQKLSNDKRAMFETEAGMTYKENISKSLKEFHASPEGKDTIKVANQKRSEWYKTSEGIEFLRIRSERTRARRIEESKNIPKRYCAVCNYTPVDNSKQCYERHLKCKKHLLAEGGRLNVNTAQNESVHPQT